MPDISEHINRQAKTQERAKRQHVDRSYVEEHDGETPKYQKLRIKQVRMSDDMIDDLYQLARQLQDQRPQKMESFTASAVARVCIGYTLGVIKRRKIDKTLRASTEEELLDVLTRQLE